MTPVVVWIVTWSVLHSVPCPSQLPDPYGREHTTIETPLCYDYAEMQKGFHTEAEAKRFVEEAPNDGKVQDFAIKKEKL